MDKSNHPILKVTRRKILMFKFCYTAFWCTVNFKHSHENRDYITLLIAPYDPLWKKQWNYHDMCNTCSSSTSCLCKWYCVSENWACFVRLKLRAMQFMQVYKMFLIHEDFRLVFNMSYIYNDLIFFRAVHCLSKRFSCGFSSASTKVGTILYLNSMNLLFHCQMF